MKHTNHADSKRIRTAARWAWVTGAVLVAGWAMSPAAWAGSIQQSVIPCEKNDATDAATRLENLNREVAALQRQLSDVEEQMTAHREVIQAAGDRLSQLSGYTETVKIQRKVNQQIEANKKAGKPTQGLTRVLIDTTLRLEEIMRKDMAVAAAMDALKALSDERRRLIDQIRQKESQAEAL